MKKNKKKRIIFAMIIMVMIALNPFNSASAEPGLIISPGSLITSEGGSSASFSVSLAELPTEAVTISVVSSDTSEGILSLNSIVFTTENWNTPQTIDVSPVDDEVVDGNQGYTINLTVTSSGLEYEGISGEVSVTNNDNDVAGIVTDPVSGLVTTEAGGQDTFVVHLATEPSGTVSISVSSSDLSEGIVSPTTLSFNSTNWNNNQTVTITGQDDSIDDDNMPYQINLSAGGASEYSGLTSSVSVTNNDNDVAGIVADPVSGLVTTEAGGQDTFVVHLATEPSGTVSISVSSSDLSEGIVNPTTLSFNSTNWNNNQTITITGQDDSLDDGNIAYQINLSASGTLEYSGLTSSVSVTNNDNDTAGIIVNPLIGLTTTEGGGIASFTVRLNTQPIASIVLSVTSQDTTEGLPDKSTLTFTTANWNVLQTVTVTGVNDSMDDNDIDYTVSVSTLSGSSEYTNLAPVLVSLTNIDDDNAGLIVNPLSGFITNESGLEDQFTVRLATQPTNNFVLGVSSLDTTEGSVSPSSLTFTSANWESPQTITIHGEDDLQVDGTVTYQVRLSGSSGASEYMILSPQLLSIQNQDNDSIGVAVQPTTGLVTTENGGTAQFNVRLNSQPAFPVTINLSSSRPSEGLPLVSSIELNASNWVSGVTVTVRGQDDNIDEEPNNQPYTIILSNTISSDLNYNDLETPDVNLTNTDDDIAGFTLSETSLTVHESGTSSNFNVYLDTQPTQDVVFSISNSDTSEGQVSPLTLTFTSGNYNSPQTITVTGVNDFDVDGNQSFRVYVDPTSSDPKYQALSNQYVSVTNLDDDIAGFTISPDRTMITNEEGSSDRFTVVLDARPQSGTSVTIPISSSDTSEGTISIPATGTLVFTPSNWMTPQEVVIVGVDDDLQDGSQNYEINVGPSESADSHFDNLPLEVVNALNNDNDTAGILFSQTDGLVTTEAGGTALFTLRLNTKPLFDVTVRLSSTDTGEGLITDPALPNRLIFTQENWNIAQTITLTGVDDFLADGDIDYQITFSLESVGADYNNLSITPINVVNLDNDFSPVAVEDNYYINGDPLTISSPGVLLNDIDANGDELTAVLESQPAQDSDIVFNPDGSFTYQANTGFEGMDQFTYKAYDGISYSEIGTVYIEVDLTAPPIANWISPVTNNNTYTVETGNILLRAAPLDEEDFGYLWYTWYDPTLPGGVEDQLVSLGTAETAPYSISINVDMLDIGFNQLFVFVYDKAGNRSLPPNNRIIIERLPYYSYQIYMPIIFK
ncbi:MAG: hypothetical protein CL609_08535 [Anaerolineaceae bacterium]|nr:hypothetical protein [Anaerolineaceae bacterium]